MHNQLAVFFVFISLSASTPQEDPWVSSTALCNHGDVADILFSGRCFDIAIGDTFEEVTLMGIDGFVIEHYEPFCERHAAERDSAIAKEGKSSWGIDNHWNMYLSDEDLSIKGTSPIDHGLNNTGIWSRLGLDGRDSLESFLHTCAQTSCFVTVPEGGKTCAQHELIGKIVALEEHVYRFGGDEGLVSVATATGRAFTDKSRVIGWPQFELYLRSAVSCITNTEAAERYLRSLARSGFLSSSTLLSHVSAGGSLLDLSSEALKSFAHQLHKDHALLAEHLSLLVYARVALDLDFVDFASVCDSLAGDGGTHSTADLRYRRRALRALLWVTALPTSVSPTANDDNTVNDNNTFHMQFQSDLGWTMLNNSLSGH